MSRRPWQEIAREQLTACASCGQVAGTHAEWCGRPKLFTAAQRQRSIYISESLGPDFRVLPGTEESW